MAWDDPSPRARAATPRPADAPPASQPGYGAAPISFGRLVFALLGAGIAGLATALATRHGLSALEGHAARATLLDVLLSIAIGLVVAVFAWRYVASRPGGAATAAADDSARASSSGDFMPRPRGSCLNRFCLTARRRVAPPVEESVLIHAPGNGQASGSSIAASRT